MKIRTLLFLLHSEPGASGSTPSTPTQATPGGDDVIEAPSEPTAGVEVDFEALSKEFDTEHNEDIIDPPDVPEPSAPASPPAPAQPASTQPSVQGQPAVPGPGATSPPATPPAAPAPAPAAAPAQPAPQAQPQPAQPTAPQPQATPASEPVTAQSIEAAYNTYQANILPQLESHYRMTPEQLTELEDNPGAAIPKMLARVHLQSQIAAYTGVMSQMPRVVGMVMERFREVQGAEEKFYGRWPKLREADQKIVDMTLRTFRSANPNMNTAEMIEKAGLMIMLSLGLDPTPGQPNGQVPIQQQVPVVPPHIPAGRGTPAPSINTRGGNVFEQMAEDMRNEET